MTPKKWFINHRTNVQCQCSTPIVSIYQTSYASCGKGYYFCAYLCFFSFGDRIFGPCICQTEDNSISMDKDKRRMDDKD